MIIQDSLKKFGDYVLLMRRVFTIPDRWREFFKRYISEIYKLGIDSILRRRIGYPRCYLIRIFLFHIMSDLGR